MALIVGGRPMVHGVDISNWQNRRGPVNYGLVAQSQDFMVAKASEGVAFKDPYYIANRNGWLTTGKPFSAYHWLKPNMSWKDQADAFLKVTSYGAGCDWLTLDAEERGITDTQVVNWCKYVEDQTGRHIVIYCGAGTDPQYRSAAWLDYTPWLASYTANYTPNPDPTKIRLPKAPGPWGRWDIWQYTSSGTVPGLEGAIDLNVADASWFNSVTNTMSEEDDEMAPPFFQRTSDNDPHLIFPDTGIRVNFATLDGVTGEAQVKTILDLQGFEPNVSKRVVEKPKINDPAWDWMILRSYSEIPDGPAIVRILLDAIAQSDSGDGTPIDAQEVAQAVLAVLKEQINK